MPHWTPSDYQAFLARRVAKSTAPEPAQDPAASEIVEVSSSEFQATLDRLEVEGKRVEAIDVLRDGRYRLTVRPKSSESV